MTPKLQLSPRAISEIHLGSVEAARSDNADEMDSPVADGSAMARRPAK
jgi:hypothetical protein